MTLELSLKQERDVAGEGRGQGTVWGRARSTRHQSGEFYKEFRISGALGRSWVGQVIRDEFGKNSGPGPERHRWSLDSVLKVIGFQQRF